MKKLNSLSIFILLLSVCSCSTSKLSGLWEVEKVQIGTDEMTPSGRWVQFNKDGTQQSGNGWRQHSIGTWEFDSTLKSLNMENTNGYEDSNAPFKISYKDHKMLWTREEEGQPVVVTLKRTSKLPLFHGDKLLGVWDLISVKENEENVTASYDPTNKNYLFFRWDNVYNEHFTKKGNKSGSYKVHGHKHEIEMIAYGEDCKREWWEFEVTADKLVLKSTNSKPQIIKAYRRIRYFPE